MGVILTVISGSSNEDVIKNELLNINSKWIYDNKQTLMNNLNIQVDFLEVENKSELKNNKKLYDSKKREYYNPVVKNDQMKLKDSMSPY